MGQPVIDQPMEVITGLAFTIVVGFGVGWFLRKAAPEPKRPHLVGEDDWKAIVERVGYGDWLGFLERLLSFIAFAASEYAIVGGWLAFKLAAKWEVWKNIIHVPANIESIPPLPWYQARKQFGSWLLSRFLIGTLANVVIGFVGVRFGKLYCTYSGWFCS